MPALQTELRQLWHLRRLLLVLAARDVRQRIMGSAGGVLWVWLPPLLTVAAYYLVFDVVFGMRLAAGAPTARVGAYLVVGILPWMAFADAAQRGMTSLLEVGDMLQKNPLPPALFPARAVLASAVVFAPLVLGLVPLYMRAHQFGSGLCALLPLLLLQGVLSFQVAWLLAILAAALRDVVQVVGVVLSLGVFLSPVLFPLSMFPERWRPLLWLNPMTAPVLGYQSALLQGVWPRKLVWLVTLAWIAVLALLLAVAVARSRDQLVDWL